MTLYELMMILSDHFPVYSQAEVMIAASSDDIHEHVTANVKVEFYDNHLVIRSQD